MAHAPITGQQRRHPVTRPAMTNAPSARDFGLQIGHAATADTEGHRATAPEKGAGR